MLESYPKLRFITAKIDEDLAARHAEFFGAQASRPFSRLKREKVIHDPLWGTNSYYWPELALIDSPLLQRLRFIHQTGLAYHVYPSARHSRFEHSLGIVTIASRIFEALFERYSGTILTIAKEKEISHGRDSIATAHRLKQELRLAALLHDTGHSLFSHASERVYSRIGLLQDAAEELSDLIGKEKGSGEVLSFCIAKSKSVATLLERARQKVRLEDFRENEDWDIDLDNVALLIVGSAGHPHLQFMGDIISSGLDADKLDYMLRDASSAGLPLRYDLERYLYTVALESDYMVDVDSALTKLYAAVGTKISARSPVKDRIRLPYYDTYRLRLPKRASSTMEQIVICKIMLFSYIYHHQKVRAAEGLLEKLLTRITDDWKSRSIDDSAAVLKFLGYDDCSIQGEDFLRSSDEEISNTSYRIVNRILPREVYRFSPAISHSGGELIKEFFLMLREREKRAGLIAELEKALGDELVRIDKRLAGKTASEALWTAGAWVDVPKPPNVEEVELSTGEYPTVTIENLFPIEEWTEAYQAHRYYVRVYAYSEYVDSAIRATRVAVEHIIGIRENSFFDSCLRKR